MKQQFHPLQFVLILLNVLALAAGLGVLILGLYFDLSYHMSRLYFLDDWFFTFPLLVSINGSILVLVSLFGVIAAILKRRVGLIIFSSLMLAMVSTDSVWSRLYCCCRVATKIFEDFGRALNKVFIRGRINRSLH